MSPAPSRTSSPSPTRSHSPSRYVPSPSFLRRPSVLNESILSPSPCPSCASLRAGACNAPHIEYETAPPTPSPATPSLRSNASTSTSDRPWGRSRSRSTSTELQARPQPQSTAARVSFATTPNHADRFTMGGKRHYERPQYADVQLLTHPERDLEGQGEDEDGAGAEAGKKNNEMHRKGGFWLGQHGRVVCFLQCYCRGRVCAGREERKVRVRAKGRESRR